MSKRSYHSRQQYPELKRGVRVKVRDGWESAGSTATVLCASIRVDGWWTAIEWDEKTGEPDWFKSEGLEVIPDCW